MSPTLFQERILHWFDQYGRKDLPWQKDITPYHVMLSEIMLQQTQVSTVIPYYLAFLDSFPTLENLAEAPLDRVLSLWSGLGYYARARNLHKAAQMICGQNAFPDSLETLMALPGIGRSTAGAILSIAFKQSHPILDGNVKRVLARYRAVSGWPGTSKTSKQLWQISSDLTPTERVSDYTQAMMDLGATLCTRTRPACEKCPIASDCLAYNNQTVELYPESKKAKQLPIKQVTFLLMQNSKQQIYLQKRPPVGVWGGLWSLPEFAAVTNALSWCQNIGKPLIKTQQLETRRHTFSHFHLDFTPFVVKTECENLFVTEAQTATWFNKLQIEQLGLAAPIRLLLQEYFRRNE